MPPVMSKLANATDLGQESMPSSVHDENDISVYDSRLAYIILMLFLVLCAQRM